MKVELLAARLAKKTNTPILEDILLGRRPATDLPDSCVIWTGKKTPGGTIIKSARDANNIPFFYRTIRRPMGQIQVAGNVEYVQRLVYKLLAKPECEFRMRNVCGNNLCVNPKHWDIKSDIPDIIFDSPDWTMEEVIESLEMFLTRYEPESWADVIVNPLLQDIPLPLLREGLIKLNKEHLT